MGGCHGWGGRIKGASVREVFDRGSDRRATILTEAVLAQKIRTTTLTASHKTLLFASVIALGYDGLERFVQGEMRRRGPSHVVTNSFVTSTNCETAKIPNTHNCEVGVLQEFSHGLC